MASGLNQIASELLNRFGDFNRIKRICSELSEKGRSFSKETSEMFDFLFSSLVVYCRPFFRMIRKRNDTWQDQLQNLRIACFKCLTDMSVEAINKAEEPLNLLVLYFVGTKWNMISETFKEAAAYKRSLGAKALAKMKDDIYSIDGNDYDLLRSEIGDKKAIEALEHLNSMTSVCFSLLSESETRSIASYPDKQDEYENLLDDRDIDELFEFVFSIDRKRNQMIFLMLLEGYKDIEIAKRLGVSKEREGIIKRGIFEDLKSFRDKRKFMRNVGLMKK